MGGGGNVTCSALLDAVGLSSAGGASGGDELAPSEGAPGCAVSSAGGAAVLAFSLGGDSAGPPERPL